MPAIDNILVTQLYSDASINKLKETFKNVHYYPNKTDDIPKEVLDKVDFLFPTYGGFPDAVKSPITETLPSLKHIQLASAGCGSVTGHPLFQEYLEKYSGSESDRITLGTASGTHVLSIPNYVVGCVINLYHQLPAQILIARNEQRWCQGKDYDHSGKGHYARQTLGKTAGMLGYGALGRESARLLKALGMKIIVANTSGKATVEADSYIIPGTGDKDGSIPDKYYSTKDEGSLEAFLKEVDVLVCSMPETPKTRYMLDAKKLALLKPNALFINVGRGSLIKSEHILEALDAPDGLFGAGLDVTDPEPLPQGHPLWSHPKVIVTPHLSGDTEGEFDIATDIAIENAKRIRNGEQILNLVDFERGY